ncbi:hypothetical protein THF5G08_120166 [Vibrio jasicida]|uniref:hypothetical protein n=1 Tax=Vibrio jasicida TaxID=766224 RepID=UPI0028942976|nr:hypothetical protein THF5G08_120166 [Vibrio jasicida]
MIQVNYVLSHGVNEQGELVSIHEVSAGRVPLTCPFCGQGLIAEKGSQKEHHFAHDGQTCVDAKAILQMTALPLFDGDMGLSKTEITLLEKLSRWRSFSRTWLSSKQRAALDELVVSGLIEFQEGAHNFLRVVENIIMQPVLFIVPFGKSDILTRISTVM